MNNYDNKIKKLEDEIKNLDERVTKLENKPKSEVDSSLEMNVAKNLKNLKTPNLVIICLKIESNQTFDKMKKTLKKWE